GSPRTACLAARSTRWTRCYRTRRCCTEIWCWNWSIRVWERSTSSVRRSSCQRRRSPCAVRPPRSANTRPKWRPNSICPRLRKARPGQPRWRKEACGPLRNDAGQESSRRDLLLLPGFPDCLTDADKRPDVTSVRAHMREKTMADVSMKRDGRTLEIELACPGRANALTANAVESILDAIEGEAAEGVSLVIFSGQGRNFSSGFDMSNVESASDGDLLYRMIRIEMLLQAVFHAPFMTLALAHGNVVGAGADLMCACSMRVAAPGSAFLMPGLR